MYKHYPFHAYGGRFRTIYRIMDIGENQNTQKKKKKVFVNTLVRRVFLGRQSLTRYW